VPTRTRRTLAQYGVYETMIKAANEMERAFVELLKPYDLSMTQYNVLRILRGGGAAGLSCGTVGGRLMRHDPDVTRLLDRLERRGLIERVRDAQDRRIVRTRATAAALDLLAELDAPVDAVHERQLGHLTEARLQELRTLIENAGLVRP
jgi:DNA-binding MarR family transcriptional regulator